MSLIKAEEGNGGGLLSLIFIGIILFLGVVSICVLSIPISLILGYHWYELALQYLLTIAHFEIIGIVLLLLSFGFGYFLLWVFDIDRTL